MKTDNDYSFPQFTQAQVDKLASGDVAALNEVCRWLVGQFDSIVRYLAKRYSYALWREDVEDIVQTYWGKKFISHCRQCRAEKMSAKQFNGIFYSSLNFAALDYIRQIQNAGHDRRKTDSTQQPAHSNDPEGQTIEDTIAAPLPPFHESATCLSSLDREKMLADIHDFLVDWTGGNELKVWVVEHAALYGDDPRLVVKKAAVQFPGKNIDADTVSQWKARFFGRPELRKILCTYFNR